MKFEDLQSVVAIFLGMWSSWKKIYKKTHMHTHTFVSLPNKQTKTRTWQTRFPFFPTSPASPLSYWWQWEWCLTHYTLFSNQLSKQIFMAMSHCSGSRRLASSIPSSRILTGTPLGTRWPSQVVQRGFLFVRLLVLLLLLFCFVLTFVFWLASFVRFDLIFFWGMLQWCGEDMSYWKVSESRN